MGNKKYMFFHKLVLLELEHSSENRHQIMCLSSGIYQKFFHVSSENNNTKIS